MDYPLYLINGRAPNDPETLERPTREKVRLRLINPSGETTFRFAVGGHKLSITHSDGQPVEPVEVDVVRIGPGERYDVIVEANNPGVWQVAAAPEGKNGLARAILRYEESSQSSPPPTNSRPQELSGRFLSYGDLRTTREETFPADGLFGGPDRTLDLTLSGGMGNYVWTIDGQAYPDADPTRGKQRRMGTVSPHQPEHDGPPHASARSLFPAAKRHRKGAVQGHGARRASHGRGDVRLPGG